MTPIVLLAGLAAIAIIVIAIGVAMSGGSGISDRLERYAAKPDAKKQASGQGGVAEMIQSSEAMARVNKVVEQRDFWVSR